MFNHEDRERLERIEAVQYRLARLFSVLFKRGEFLMAAIDNLEANVGAQTTALNGALMLLDQIHDALVAIPNLDPRVQAVADQLETNRANIAAAVIRDTIAAPEPPAPIVPPVV